jgi:hypothetical protein
MQNFTFQGKGVHYWRAKTERIYSFDELVRWFQREHGLSRANAIQAARRTRPELYNAHMQALHSRNGVQTVEQPRGGGVMQHFRIVGA